MNNGNLMKKDDKVKATFVLLCVKQLIVEGHSIFTRTLNDGLAFGRIFSIFLVDGGSGKRVDIYPHI